MHGQVVGGSEGDRSEKQARQGMVQEWISVAKVHAGILFPLLGLDSSSEFP